MPDTTSNGDKTPHDRTLGREARVFAKRFYASAAAAVVPDGFAIALDGRPARTPGKRGLIVARESLAAAIAAEWAAQVDVVRPETMPLTQIACTAIDGVSNAMAEVAADIGAFAMSDLLCYRAEAPRELVELQSKSWDPIITWAESVLGVRFSMAEGVMPVAQDPALKSAVVARISTLDAMQLAALHVLTTLMGSAALALAVQTRRLDLPAAWALAHLDEDWQIKLWGGDSEAIARRERRLATALAAAQVFDLTA
jgi:chaperone required for assembly of F1-ATPase